MSIKDQIKRKVQNNPTLYSLIRIIKNRQDQQFIETVNNYDMDPRIILMEPGRIYDPEVKPVCQITAGNKDEGFFACLRWALDGLYFCDQMGLIPVIKFPDDSLYRDESIFDTKENPFEYYFERTSGLDDTVLGRYPQVIYHKRNMLMAEQLNGGINYSVSSEYIKKMGDIVKKYIRFNCKTREILENYICSFQINERVLGVHIRGTDYKMNYYGHPKYVKPEDFFPCIDKACLEYGFSKIYLATDDQDIFDEMTLHYDNVIFSNSNNRGRGTTGIHTEKHRDKTPYYLGLEVLEDMYALSKCGGIVSGISQVPITARIFASSSGKQYKYDKTIDNGINENGNKFHVK